MRAPGASEAAFLAPLRAAANAAATRPMAKKRDAEMEQRRTSVCSFKAVVRCMDGVRRRRSLPGEGAAGTFDLLSDDCVARILQSILILDRGVLGKSYFDNVRETVASFAAVAAACKRMSNIIRSGYQVLQAEALARASTTITPRAPFSPYAFTEQMREELASCDHLKMLQAAQRAMTCHCAGACCYKYVRAFNRDLRAGRVFKRAASPTLANGRPQNSRLVSVMENCSSMAVSPQGTAAFAYVREQVSKRSLTSDGHRPRFQDAVVRVEARWPAAGSAAGPSFVQTAKLYIDEHDMSPPLTMCCSKAGNSVAFIRSEHDPDVNSSTAFGGVFLWTTGRPPFRVDAPGGCVPGVAEQSLSAQDCWFTQSGEDEALVVAWSTDFLHNSGHHIGSHAGKEGPMYFFATYILTDDAAPEFFEATFAEHGLLQTCSPASSGKQIVTLHKRASHFGPRREVHVHDLHSGTCSSVMTSGDRGGPICASLSPSGDAIVAIHNPGHTISMTVHVANEYGGFSLVQAKDVSIYLSLKASQNEADFDTDLVKRSIAVAFSPCSRFVALVDQRPNFGIHAENYGLVVLDMASRTTQSQSLKPFPMFSTVDQAPRGFVWTTRGIWLLPPGTDSRGAVGPRGGALCLLSGDAPAAPACVAEERASPTSDVAARRS